MLSIDILLQKVLICSFQSDDTIISDFPIFGEFDFALISKGKLNLYQEEHWFGGLVWF